METTDERVIYLARLMKTDDLAIETGIGYSRWVTIKNGRARITTQEIDALVKLYPNWAYWLTTGNVLPESGQTSPKWDEAEKLNEQERA